MNNLLLNNSRFDVFEREEAQSRNLSPTNDHVGDPVGGRVHAQSNNTDMLKARYRIRGLNLR